MTTRVTQLSERLVIVSVLNQSFVTQPLQLAQRALIITEKAGQVRLNTVEHTALIVTEAATTEGAKVYQEVHTALILDPEKVKVSTVNQVSLIVTDEAVQGACVLEVSESALVITESAPVGTSVLEVIQSALIVTEMAPTGTVIGQITEAALVVSESPTSSTNVIQNSQLALYLDPDNPVYTRLVQCEQFVLVQLEAPTPDPTRTKTVVNLIGTSTILSDPSQVQSLSQLAAISNTAVLRVTGLAEIVQSDSAVGLLTESIATTAVLSEPSTLRSASYTTQTSMSVGIQTTLIEPTKIQSNTVGLGTVQVVARKGTKVDPSTVTSNVMSCNIVSEILSTVDYGPAARQSMNGIYSATKLVGIQAVYPARAQSYTKGSAIVKSAARRSTKFVNASNISSTKYLPQLAKVVGVRTSLRNPSTISEIMRFGMISNQVVGHIAYPNPDTARTNAQNYQLVQHVVGNVEFSDPEDVQASTPLGLVEQCASIIVLSALYDEPTIVRYRRRAETSTYLVDKITD